MHIKGLSMFLGALLSTGIVAAQAPDQAQPQAQSQQATAPNGQAGNHHTQNPDRQAKHLRKELGLTAGQTAQLKPILADRAQQVQSLRSDSSLTPQDRHAKLQAIQKDSKEKIEAILNDQQKQQFEQMLQERRAKRKQPSPGE